MPADFPGWGRFYALFRRWREHGLIAEFHDRLRGKVREREDREAEPTAGIVDAQPVRAATAVPAHAATTAGGRCRAANGTSYLRGLLDDTDCLGAVNDRRWDHGERQAR
ncbi:hypothetical protein [Kitasatospora sp. NPDC017646]|uniref:hypothetical protein n=1 Tax=Kitasatospora sp. NPDC017646 TaxID=3364024 RepID=UPI0037A89761